MDSTAVRWSTALLVVGYVAAVLGFLRPVLYFVTVIGLASAVGLLLLEWATERRIARVRAARAHPLLEQWRPSYAGCF